MPQEFKVKFLICPISQGKKLRQQANELEELKKSLGRGVWMETRQPTDLVGKS